MRSDILGIGIFLVIIGVILFFSGYIIVVSSSFGDLGNVSLMMNFGIIIGVIGVFASVVGITLPKEQEKDESVEKNKEDAIEVLKLRYVKGEITKEEYEQMKKDIEGWKGGYEIVV